MITIRLIDNGCERYTIESDCRCLGRMWENFAEQIQVIKPKGEEHNVCTMIVSANGVVIDHIDIKDAPKDITNVLTRHPLVEISFTFTNENGYAKNSEIKSFYFAEGRKPEDFVPVDPEQTGKIDVLLGNGFVRADLEGNIVRFYNANGEKIQDLDLSSISGSGGSAGGEVDLTDYLKKTDIDDSDSIIHSFNGNKVKFELDDTIQNKIAKSLVTPMSRPISTELVGVDSTNSQTMIEIGDGLQLVDGVLSSTATGSGESGDGYVTLDSEQTITGKKTIKAPFYVSSQNEEFYANLNVTSDESYFEMGEGDDKQVSITSSLGVLDLAYSEHLHIRSLSETSGQPNANLLVSNSTVVMGCKSTDEDIQKHLVVLKGDGFYYDNSKVLTKDALNKSISLTLKDNGAYTLTINKG